MIALAAPPICSVRLLAGPPPSTGWERLEDHLARLGPRPGGGAGLVDVLAESGLRGRGGAWFPTWRKWAAVCRRSRGDSVVVVNASEGEPLSAKDRTLVSLRPHVVLDGAALAAETVGAEEVVIYLSRESRMAADALRRACRERRRARLRERPIHIVRTAHRYIAGESSAVVRRLEGGPAKPRFTPPHPSESGVNGRPTLVQNAETMAHVALIARHDSAWFRQCGTWSSPGTALMTLSGAVAAPGVWEVDLAGTLGAVVHEAGGTPSTPAGALLGGYFGTWLAPSALACMPLDADALRAAGTSLGCGVLAILPAGGCGIVEAARILAYLAAESAGQCGPCVRGLGAMSEAMNRVAASHAVPADIDRIRRWAEQVSGRGACRHPDGAVTQLASALTVFAEHLNDHLAGRPCPGVQGSVFPGPPRVGRGWR
jgi:NADH:ubiquinone oxidoreductase subunit F (NADH-binding)